MPESLRLTWLCALLALLPLSSVLRAQTDNPTTIPVGDSYETERSGIVSGVRIDVRPDGSVWFLVPALDRIAVLQDGVTRQWTIRDDNHLGANPVDFEIDGDFVWFLCNGESLIDAGHSIFGRLDTVTGEVREWEVPGSRPAGFYRASDGKVWIPQTDRRLQSVDLTTLEVIDYRSPATIAYSDIVVGPDGALWMTDFGNNRIVRFEPGASQETSWTMFDPTLAILSPSQIQFDPQGRLWISEFTGGRVDRFDPATGDLVSFIGFLNPIHFDLFGGRVYVTEANGSNGQIALLDPSFSTSGVTRLEAATLDVGSLVNVRKAKIRDYTITPATFTSPATAIPAGDLKVAAGTPGILRTEIPWQNAYGIDVVRGEVWVGTAGRLAHVQLQTVGSPSDLVAPVATQLAGDAMHESRVDISLHNASGETISGEAIYLFSPGSYAARQTFTLLPGGTSVISDAFGDLGSASIPVSGPIRLHVTSGPAEELAATVRTAQAREDGGSFGYATPAFAPGESLEEGTTCTLFTGFREAETSVFGFYSPSGAEAVFTLVAPDGTVRGALPISVTSNVNEEFSPAASAFGVSEEPGDVIRVSVLSGTLAPYVRIVDGGSKDTALSLPARPAASGVFPSVGNAVGMFDTIFLSDLLLSNPSDSAAAVTLSYFPLDPFEAPRAQTLTLSAGESRAIEFVLPTIFQVDPGQGAIKIDSDVPVVSALRIAARREEGDFATLALPIESEAAVSESGSAFAIQAGTRRTNLILFNGGAAGTVTVVSTNGNGDEIGRRQLAIGSLQSIRVNSILTTLGSEEEPNGRLAIHPSDGMALYAWAAQVDGPTGDVEIEAFRP